MKHLLVRRLALAFVMLFTIVNYAHAGKPPKLKHLKCRQLLVVVNNDWDSLEGNLYAFKKVRGKWRLQFKNAIVLGSKGLAIGDGLVHLKVDGPVKHEGDKRSPAGIFGIGTAFGYAEKKDAGWIKNPYVQAFDTLICVDDANSSAYNKLVNKDTARRDYNSFEYMHLKKDYYKWGLFINHNSDKVVPGDGSCIFMHIWENDHTGTDGCTAMAESNMLRVLHWIDANERPILLQVPRSVYKKLKRQFALPVIKLNAE
jgi:L,D-peptidoglycan transpeptidase YkuD (ErfK/YbiS/YcfS/YnhG family)